jgi:hypothetical protein
MKFNQVHQDTERYVHHGSEVAVLSEQKGKHRLFCLCHNHCKFFKPELPASENCPLAQANFEFDVANNLTTPVMECPKYEQE